MTADYYPFQVPLLAFSGWVNREQQRTIEYLVEDSRVLEEQFKGRKLRLTEDTCAYKASRSRGRCATLTT